MSVIPHTAQKRLSSAPRSLSRVLLKSAKFYGNGLLKALYTLPVFLWAQAVAFKVFITLLPLILLATGVFGLILRQENSFEIVKGFLREFLPAAQSEPLLDLVGELQSASGGLTIVAAAAFMVTVITLFSTLRYVIGTAMGGDRHQMRSILGGYLFDIRMVVQVGVLFLVSFAITVGARLVKQFGREWGLDPVVVEQLERVFGWLVVLVPYAITLGMIVQLYYFIPMPHPPFRSAIQGAAVTAVLFEAAKNGFALYATHIGKFDRYASGEAADGLGGLGGVFGLLLAFVFWVYLSGLILVIGAVVTSLHEKRHRPRRSALRRMWNRFGIRRRRPLPEGADAMEVPDASGETPDASGETPDASGETPDASGETPEATTDAPEAATPPTVEAGDGASDPAPEAATPPTVEAGDGASDPAPEARPAPSGG